MTNSNFQLPISKIQFGYWLIGYWCSLELGFGLLVIIDYNTFTSRVIGLPYSESQEMTDHHIDQFRSPTFGLMNLGELVDRVVDFIQTENNSHFRVVIGTDSELTNGSTAHFVSAVVVHHVGHGGVYFWGQITRSGIKSLRQRMYEEATYSLTLAQTLLDEFHRRELLLDKLLEIHVDVGQNGDTKVMINEIVGMIRGSGFICKTKPESFAASNVADRHT